MSFLRLTILSLFLVACANHNGIFEPACMALEGERFELRNGTYSWQRFTDQIDVDEEGNRIDPFPGFARTGLYTVEQGRVYLKDSDGQTLTERYMREYDSELYLLTKEQHDHILSGADMPECALHRVAKEKPAGRTGSDDNS